MPFFFQQVLKKIWSLQGLHNKSTCEVEITTKLLFFSFIRNRSCINYCKEIMRKMRNTPHKIQTWSKDPKRTSTLQGNLYKRNKKDSCITSPKAYLGSLQSMPTLRWTYGKPTKLNDIQGKGNYNKASHPYWMQCASSKFISS